MLTVQKEIRGASLTMKLSGVINESAKLEDHFDPSIQEVNVYCKEIARINSIGVKAWIRYFQGYKNIGAKLFFHECSTAIVEQLNLVSNFSAGGKVLSVFVPFACKKCSSEMIALFKTEDLVNGEFTMPELNCQKCPDGVAVFDDVEEEYFAFLKKG